MKNGKLAVLALLTAGLLAGITPAHALPSPAPGTPSAPAGSLPTDDSGLSLPGTAPSAPAVPAPAVPAPAAPTPAPAAPPTPAVLPTPSPKAPASTAPGSEPTAEASDAAEDDAAEDKDYDPVGAGFPVPGPNTPLVTEPDGTVRSAVETDITASDALPNPTPAAAQGVSSALAAPTRSGNVKVTLVIATLADNKGKVDVQAAKDSINASNSYWRTMSNNRLSFSIAETLTHTSKGNSNQDYAALMNTISRELGWTDGPYEALVVYVPAADLKSGGYGGILGGGWTSNGTGGRVLMPAPSSFSNNVVTHEFGHVLGLLHANSLTCSNGRSDVAMGVGGWSDGSCYSREYGDTTDLMGYAQYSLPTINSYFWDEGGFGRGNEIQDTGIPSNSKTYTLKPWAGSEANRALKFRDSSGETYYLELRLPVGYDAATATGGNRGVKITKADRANSWAVNSLSISPNTRGFAGYSNTNSAWQPGQTFTTYGGTRVTINSVGGSSASVTITGGAASQAIGPIDEAYRVNPKLGSATTAIITGLRDGGAYRNHQNGQILWAPGYGAKALTGGVRTIYNQFGAQNGVLGYPLSNELPGTKSGVYQNFEGGSIMWLAATGGHVSQTGPIRNAYAAQGYDQGSLGYPTTNQSAIPGGGIYQDYQGGSIMWHPSTGAYVSRNGEIRNAYARQGYQGGKLGYPTSNEYSAAGASIQDFQGGRLLWNPKTKAVYTLAGSIGYMYTSVGGATGSLGLPTSQEKALPTGSGSVQTFDKGSIYWTAATGARVLLNGPINDHFKANKSEKGTLGYPVSNEQSAGAGKFQDFQGGRLTWTKANGVRLLAGSINYRHGTAGGPGGYLGYPTANESKLSGGGALQTFDKGVIYWSPSTGARVIESGSIRNTHKSMGSEAGVLGYPTSEQYARGAGVIQDFQGGQIAWSPSTGTHVLRGSIGYVYSAVAGGPGGELGHPTSGEISIRNGGSYQAFQGGAIYWSPTSGAHVSKGAIRVAYAAQGWENGRLGYPTSEESARAGGSVVQQYQGGSITWAPGSGSRISYNK